MKNEKLMRAIGEIDEDLIAEAHETVKPRKRWVRWSAMAAGFALLIACVPLLMMALGGHLAFDAAPEMEMATGGDLYYSGVADSSVSAGGLKDALDWNTDHEMIKDIVGSFQGEANSPAEEKAEEAPEYGEPVHSCRVGETVRVEGLAVQYLSANETSMDLHIKKNDNVPLVISITVLSSDGETESAWLASSDRDGEYFAFAVNGEKTETLPSEGGAYDITVDFSAFLKNGARLSPRVVINDTLVLIWE